MLDVASAYWVDVKAKIKGNTTDSVEGILSDAASKTPIPLVTFIVYDLPNRVGEIAAYYFEWDLAGFELSHL